MDREEDKKPGKTDKAVDAGLKAAELAQPELAPVIKAAKVAGVKPGTLIKALVGSVVAIYLLVFMAISVIMVVFFGRGAGAGPCVSGVTNLTGSDNIQKAYNYFVAKGLSANQSAGILGNLWQESGVIPDRDEKRGTASSPMNGSGFGIAQWTFTVRQQPLVDMANDRGVPVTDLALQLDYLWLELTTDYKGVYERLKASSELDDAVNIFVGPNDVKGNPVSPTTEVARSGGFENPGKPHMVKRLQYAAKTLELYGDGASPGDFGACEDATIPTGTAKELARQLLESPNIASYGRLVREDLQLTTEGKPGTAGKPMDEKLLQLLVAMAERFSFHVTALQSGGTGHDSPNSNHFQGKAADLVASGSSSYDEINTFIYQNRSTFNIDELIFYPMPSGVCTLDKGQCHQYSAGTLYGSDGINGDNGHEDHIHVSVQ